MLGIAVGANDKNNRSQIAFLNWRTNTKKTALRFLGHPSLWGQLVFYKEW